MSKPVCLITGVGPGTGAALSKRFARDYAVAMLARNEARLEQLAESEQHCHAYVCDVADHQALVATHERVCTELGPPAIVIHNAVGGGWGDFLSIDPELLRTNFEVNVQALLHLGQLTAPAMIEAGSGVIMATGNTAAYRGKAHFAGFAPTKAAQRILLEAMARRLGPDGIHVAFVAIDAVIDLRWTRKRYADKPDDFFCKPDDIAEHCFGVAHQPRSAWTFDSKIRPFGETW